jgi:hypothetical protein
MRGLVVAVFALLALAPAAHAADTIGGLFPAAPLSSRTDPAGITAAPVGVTVPAAGIITLWRVRVGADPTPVRLRVLRAGQEVARSDQEAAPANDTASYETHITVAPGDRIAVDCCATAPGGALFAAVVGQSTDIWPTLVENADVPSPTNVPDVGTALEAVIEPDRDNDGLADDSEDSDDDNDGVPDATDVCPTTPAMTANGCPPPPPPPPPAPAARVNTPPTVRFRTPLAGTAVRASQVIELEVSDDAGNPTVSLFDDDGTICTVSGPPYSCTWTPTGADVGRATLLASAVDGDGRSTLGIVRVRVSRFKADLTARRRGRTVSGRLVLPAAVERSLGCTGEVTVRRGKTRRTVKLKRNCTYSVRLPRGRGTPRARFAGNAVVQPAT